MRRQGRDEDGFALVLMMLLILIIGTVSLTVLGLLLSQLTPTQLAAKRVDTVNSAGAGLQAALSQLRAATTSSGTGNPGALPCSLSGWVNGDATDTYQVTVRYFPAGQDPTGMTDAQRTAAQLGPCPLQNVVPGYALLQNAGSSTRQPVGHAGRSIEATYVFSTTNKNASGGRMRNSSQTLCWDVGTAPAAGTTVTWQTCGPVNLARQAWRYRPDLSLFWAGGAPSASLCLDDSAFYAQASSPRPARAVTLQTCLEPDPEQVGTYPYSPAAEKYQEFGAHWNWWAVKDTGEGDGSGDCLGPGNSAVVVGAAVVLAPSNQGCTNLRAENAVGAGAAAAIGAVPGATKQLVNYADFGRCLDVSGSNPANGLIFFPCHAAPDINKIEGNQQFTFSGAAGGTGTLSTVRPGFYTTQCMTSPLTTGGARVTLANCAGSTAQTWLFTGAILGDYPNSYTIRDSAGLCLTGGANPVVQVCDGTDGQKWNAPAGLVQSSSVRQAESTGR